MGKTNALYQEFERTIIEAYDEELLTPGLLDELAAIFRGKGMSDDGALLWIETNDGKMVDQVCVECLEPNFVPEIETWLDPEDGPKQREMWYEEFVKLRKERWGWTS
jgi:hypothetical protein